MQPMTSADIGVLSFTRTWKMRKERRRFGALVLGFETSGFEPPQHIFGLLALFSAVKVTRTLAL
jgi:hypothetical protein